MRVHRFRSLARNESTRGSDLDWTLLIDGQADPQHVRAAQEIGGMLDKLEKTKPGPTGVFGGLTFSHDLIHAIGGQADTNANTTRRILLLLESCVVGPDHQVRDRVVRHLFSRYVGEDRGYHQSREWQVKVPRFLLNDIVRFWRTMAVDYASKRRDRAHKGWALRNFKLRLSRKLIFVSGLAMCLRCQLTPSDHMKKTNFDTEEEFHQALGDFLVQLSNSTPLDIVAQLCLDFNAIEAGGKIFDAYEGFLEVLDDSAKRDKLEKLDVDESDDKVFEDTRAIGNAFQDGLSKLFFNSNEKLTEATQRYGVF